MTLRQSRAGRGLVAAAAMAVLLAAAPASAQPTMPSSGWPTAAAPATPKPEPTPVRTAPAATRRRPTRKAPTMRDLVRALETQSALLTRLVAELEESRAIIRGHGAQLAALAGAIAATVPAPAPAATEAPSPAVGPASPRFADLGPIRSSLADLKLMQKTFFGVPPDRQTFLVTLRTAW